MDHFYYLCFVFAMLSCLFIAALWSPAGKGYLLVLLCVMFAFGSLVCGVCFLFLSHSHVMSWVKCGI